MDKIKIKDLEIYGHHGVLQEENALGQKFLVSVVLWLNLKEAGKTDDLHKSVNYSEVSHFIKEFMENNTFQLIEAVAEGIAKGILLQFPLVKKIKIQIKKPWAPILLPLDTVSVEIKRRWHKVYLGIGSNLGDKEKNLKNAIQLLEEKEGIRIDKVSNFIITEPVGQVEQDDFLNGAAAIETLLEPEELLQVIGEIEKQLKRVRTVHWGPRTIDLDILLYDNKVIHTENLMIPHKEMINRSFVLEPLAEIAPDVVHPVKKKTVEELRQKLKEKTPHL